MTISSTTRTAGPFTAGAGPFAFTFRVFAASDVLVERTSAAGTTVTLTPTTDYTVAVNADQATNPGGSVTLVTALTGGQTLLIGSQVPEVQPAALLNAGGYFPAVVEAALDRLTILVQQLRQAYSRFSGRALQVPESGGVVTFPAVAERALKLAAFDGLGQPTVVLPEHGGSQTLQLELLGAGASQGAGMVAYVPAAAYQAGSVGRHLQRWVVVATVAELRGVPSANTERVTTLGYYAAGDGGAADYRLDPTDNSTADNGGTVLVAAGGQRYKLIVTGEAISSRVLGVKGDGVTGETTVLMAADAMCRALKKSLLIEGIVLLNATAFINNPTRWMFSGHNGSGGSNLMIPASYLLASPSIPTYTAAVAVTTDGVQFDGGGLYGAATAGGTAFAFDGLIIGGYGFRWTGAPVIGRFGRDGIRVGTDTAPAYNGNGFHLDAPVVHDCGRHGINIDDLAGAPTGANANTFEIEKPFVHHCVGHGIRFGNTYLGGTITAPLVERCGAGLYFEDAARGIVVMGGDLEDCTGPAGVGPNVPLVEVQPGNNILIGVTVQGVVRSTLNSARFQVAWAPVMRGLTTPGTSTSTAKGVRTVGGGRMQFEAKITWSGHTSAGEQACIEIPSSLGSTTVQDSLGFEPPIDIPCHVQMEGVTIPTGLMSVRGLIRVNNVPPLLRLWVPNGGGTALDPYPLPAAGTIYISGSFPIGSV